MPGRTPPRGPGTRHGAITGGLVQIVDERQLDVKRISDTDHVRERETIRIGQSERREPIGALPGLSEELFPLEAPSPSLPVQMGDEFGGDAGARGCDAALKRW